MISKLKGLYTQTPRLLTERFLFVKIDSHQHYWTLSRGDYGWMSPDLGPIFRDFSPDDLSPLLKASGIDKTIVVQAADSVAETEFLLGLADKTPSIAGVVGWVDMAKDDSISTLERLAKNPKFKGIRPMIQDIEDNDWILRPVLDRTFEALVELGLSFDALVLPKHLRNLQTRLEKHPNLACVIDHAAKPTISTGDLSDWCQDIQSIADNSTAFCKLSGLLTEAGDTPTLNAISPAANHVLDAFGPQRLMFGSDWPVLNLACDYPAWTEMVESLVHDLPAKDRAAIWGMTAQKFYKV